MDAGAVGHRCLEDSFHVGGAQRDVGDTFTVGEDESRCRMLLRRCFGEDQGDLPVAQGDAAVLFGAAGSGDRERVLLDPVERRPLQVVDVYLDIVDGEFAERGHYLR